MDHHRAEAGAGQEGLGEIGAKGAKLETIPRQHRHRHDHYDNARHTNDTLPPNEKFAMMSDVSTDIMMSDEVRPGRSVSGGTGKHTKRITSESHYSLFHKKKGNTLRLKALNKNPDGTNATFEEYSVCLEKKFHEDFKPKCDFKSHVEPHADPTTHGFDILVFSVKHLDGEEHFLCVSKTGKRPSMESIKLLITKEDRERCYWTTYPASSSAKEPQQREPQRLYVFLHSFSKNTCKKSEPKVNCEDKRWFLALKKSKKQSKMKVSLVPEYRPINDTHPLRFWQSRRIKNNDNIKFLLHSPTDPDVEPPHSLPTSSTILDPNTKKGGGGRRPSKPSRKRKCKEADDGNFFRRISPDCKRRAKHHRKSSEAINYLKSPFSSRPETIIPNEKHGRGRYKSILDSEGR